MNKYILLLIVSILSISCSYSINLSKTYSEVCSTYKFAFPIEKDIESYDIDKFGPIKHPFTGEISFFEGIRIYGKYSQKIFAVIDGDIVKAENGIVIIKNKDLIIEYKFILINKYIKTGDIIKKGQLLGYIKSQSSKGPFFLLFFRYRNIEIDPFFVLNSS